MSFPNIGILNCCIVTLSSRNHLIVSKSLDILKQIFGFHPSNVFSISQLSKPYSYSKSSQSSVENVIVYYSDLFEMLIKCLLSSDASIVASTTELTNLVIDSLASCLSSFPTIIQSNQNQYINDDKLTDFFDSVSDSNLSWDIDNALDSITFYECDDSIIYKYASTKLVGLTMALLQSFSKSTHPDEVNPTTNETPGHHDNITVNTTTTTNTANTIDAVTTSTSTSTSKSTSTDTDTDTDTGANTKDTNTDLNIVSAPQNIDNIQSGNTKTNTTSTDEYYYGQPSHYTGSDNIALKTNTNAHSNNNSNSDSSIETSNINKKNNFKFDLLVDELCILDSFLEQL
ncbi:hypothetical protein AX774_g7498 [Zancudomyces culisetae]|uniref:Uncharacterized protein n=1 Tax=Zancudomyces culisetae TaxID=1213189 RepID=A0A1R1PDZ0_ZANCU|nr:hypothetical protein AX774_g7498 [Zancudomyces culisetae]|eukprot:OMH79092.1 hypothetical protein AX774_g7498 [Zancudomyces culisetae]